MPVFRLGRELAFPPVEWAGEDGLLAVGGDLRPERLLLAYSQGIFPWHENRGWVPGGTRPQTRAPRFGRVTLRPSKPTY